MVLDAPFFKETIEIGKFSKEIFKVKTRSWMYMDSKEVFLKPKKKSS
jgi:diphthamide synthase (EF-2-diphthine--ammonia ligase)